MNTLNDEAYRKLHALLSRIDSNTLNLSRDYNFLSEDDKKIFGDDTFTITRAIREITGLNTHQQMIKQQLEQEQLQSIESNKEYIPKFVETISQEMTAIKDPQYFRNFKLNPEATSAADLFDVTIEHHPSSPTQEPNYPNPTKEEWLGAIENVKAHFEEQYNNSRQYEIKDTTQYNDWLKMFGKPPVECEWFIKPVFTEVFVDEEILALTKGFMLETVGMFNNKAVMADYEQKYDNIHEMKIFLWVQAKTKDIVIYYTAKQGGKYIFRGAFIDKTNES